MLVTWMLPFGVQGTEFISISPAGLAAATARQSATPLVRQTLGRAWEVASAGSSLLDSGFRAMYNLDFSGAQQQFAEYERQNPGDPIGPVANAAGLLFSEFNRGGVSQSQVLVKDPSFLSRSKLVAAAAVLGKCDLAIQRSLALAEKRLASDASDRDALLASAFAAGLQAECLALMQNRGLAALQYAQQATSYVRRWLTACPDSYGAYLATDGGGCWIGCRTVPARWILRASGFAVDKREEIKDLQIVAQHGHYLAPFAEILLTIAYLRDKEPQQARMLLAELRAGFPESAVFARELKLAGGAAELEARRGPDC